MDKIKKPAFLETIRTFWPVLMFVFVLLFWALQKQTASSTDFISLEIRVALLEERILDKDTILKMNEGLVRVETKIEELSRTIIRMENQMFEKFRGKH